MIKRCNICAKKLFSYSICWYLSLLEDGSDKYNLVFSYSICWYLSTHYNLHYAEAGRFRTVSVDIYPSNYAGSMQAEFVFVQYLLIFIFASFSILQTSSLFSYSICWYLSKRKHNNKYAGVNVFVQYLLIFIPLKIKVYKIYYRWK